MLSVLLCVKNEFAQLKDCFEALSFADEIIVVDDFSTDGTYEYAQELGAKVYQRSLQGDFASQRNFGIAQCTGDWVLVVDADERVTPALTKSIQEKTQKDQPYRCYDIRRLSTCQYHPMRHGIFGVDYVKRLAPREGLRYVGLVHERLESPYPTERSLTGEMMHYTYESWDQYYAKANKYSTLMATQNYQDGKKVYFLRDVVLRPWIGFLKMYLVKGGFLDGRLGFVFSVNHAVYVMMKYVKLYTLRRTQGKL